MSAQVQVLTPETFDSVVSGTGAYLVDFWADWCQPCHVMHPILDELAEAYAGRATVASVDVHEHPLLGERFGVVSLPTMVFFRDGEPVQRLSGAKRRPQLERVLDELIG